MRTHLPAAMAAIPLVTTACGGANPTVAAAGSTQALTIKGLDALRFEPSALSAKAGQPIRVAFENSGRILHDSTLTQGVGKPVVILEAGGETGSASFTIGQPGTCQGLGSQPGPAAAGMVGTLTIE
jgi:uncharacterized cupredoxin-like copper-binding protein